MIFFFAQIRTGIEQNERADARNEQDEQQRQTVQREAEMNVDGSAPDGSQCPGKLNQRAVVRITSPPAIRGARLTKYANSANGHTANTRPNLVPNMR